jgi:hypothetical protein
VLAHVTKPRVFVLKLNRKKKRTIVLKTKKGDAGIWVQEIEACSKLNRVSLVSQLEETKVDIPDDSDESVLSASPDGSQIEQVLQKVHHLFKRSNLLPEPNPMVLRVAEMRHGLGMLSSELKNSKKGDLAKVTLDLLAKATILEEELLETRGTLIAATEELVIARQKARQVQILDPDSGTVISPQSDSDSDDLEF